jgi:hypothetical protein
MSGRGRGMAGTIRVRAIAVAPRSDRRLQRRGRVKMAIATVGRGGRLRALSHQPDQGQRPPRPPHNAHPPLARGSSPSPPLRPTGPVSAGPAGPAAPSVSDPMARAALDRASSASALREVADADHHGAHDLLEGMQHVSGGSSVKPLQPRNLLEDIEPPGQKSEVRRSLGRRHPSRPARRCRRRSVC